MKAKTLKLVSLGLTLAAIASGCTGEAPEKKSSVKSDLVASTPATNTSADVKTPVESAPTELLQKAVARVVAFVDVTGVNINIYQDAYSSLYQSGKKSGVSVEPILYYSPVFITDSFKLLQLSDTGELQITLKNKVTRELIRNLIVDKGGKTLASFNADPNRVSVVPLDGVSGTIKAYGKTYPVEISKDMLTAIVRIPVYEIPSELFKSPEGADSSDEYASNDKEIDGTALLESFDLFTISYKYWVQRYKEEQCSVNIDDSYINSMFQDTNCPAPKTPPSKTEVANLASKYGDKYPAIREIGGLMGQMTAPLNYCLIGQEASRLQQSATVSCTKSASDVNGNLDSGLSSQMKNFFSNAIDPLIADATIASDGKWDAKAAAAVVALFGNPDAYNSQLTKFENGVLNETDKTKQTQAIEESKDFLQTLHEHGSKVANGNCAGQTKGKGGGFSIFGVGLSGQSSSGSQNCNSVDNQSFQTDANQTLEERAKQFNEAFRDKDLQHEVQNVGGTLRLTPKLQILNQSDVNRIKQAAAAFSSNELGDIVVEPEEISAELNKRKEIFLQGQIVCNSVAKGAFQISAQQSEWWNSANFVTRLSNEASTVLANTGGCGKGLQILMYYSNASANRDLVPDAITFNLTIRTSENATSPQQASGLLRVLATSSNSSGKKPASSPAFEVRAGSSDIFTRVEFKVGNVE